MQITGLSERALTDAIIEAATIYGWLVHHDRPARTDAGWRTAIQGHVGYPDLAMVHPQHRVATFAELKGVRGVLSQEQRGWLDALGEVTSTPRTFVWRPVQWLDGTVLNYLKHPT